jgi:hypothetical protein
MLIVETIVRTGREHFIKCKTIKEIVRDPKVSRNTVRKVLTSINPAAARYDDIAVDCAREARQAALLKNATIRWSGIPPST